MNRKSAQPHLSNIILLSLVAVLFVALGVGSFTYSVKKCGLSKTLLLGEHAFTMAIFGMCEKEGE